METIKVWLDMENDTTGWDVWQNHRQPNILIEFVNA